MIYPAEWVKRWEKLCMSFTFSMGFSALVLFVVLMIFTLGKSPLLRIDRAGAAFIGAMSIILSGVLSLPEALAAIDYKTIIILFSMMLLVSNLKLSGFFEAVGDLLLRWGYNRQIFLGAVIFCSGVLSAIAINDIVCLLFTPIVLLLCRKIRCEPLPYLLGVAIASNIGSAATLLGNPQNILVGSLSGLAFFSYFAAAAVPAAFGMILTFGLLNWKYKRSLQGAWKKKISLGGTIHGYLMTKSLIIFLLVFICYLAGMELAVAAGLGAALSLLTRRVNPDKVYAGIDFNLLLMFCGLFVIVDGVEKSGLLQYALEQFAFLKVESLGSFSLLTILLSNIVSNVPAVLLLRFFIPPEQPEIWWKCLALFSTIAGNLTITGSMANLIVAEAAKRQGIRMGAAAYMQIGFPVTILLAIFSYAWLSFLR